MESNGKVRVTKFIVAKTVDAANFVDNAALPNDGRALFNNTAATVVTAGADFAPGEVMLGDGQIGIYDADTLTAITAATSPQPQRILFAQGRGDVWQTEPYPLPTRKLEKSEAIDGVYKVEMWGEISETGNYASWNIGGAAALAVNISDNTVYQLSLAYHGRRTDILNGRTHPSELPRFETPDYTDLGLSTVDARDHLLQNLAQKVNRKNTAWTPNPGINQTIAFAIDSANVAASATTVATITGGAVGDLITIGFSAVTGQAIQIALTQEMINTFTDAVAATAFAGTAGIIGTSINATAGATAGYVAGDGTANVDRLFIVEASAPEAFFDNVPQLLEDVVVGLRAGFNTSTVGLTRVTRPFEGKALARQLEILYRKTDALMKYENTILTPFGKGLDGEAIHFPSDIAQGQRYAVYTIYGNDISRDASDGTIANTPYQVYVLIPCDDEVTKDAFEAVMNNWIVNRPGNGGFTFGGTGSTAAQVVLPDCP
jgi:hypothetical protein